MIDTGAGTSRNGDTDTGYVRNTNIVIDTDIDTGYKIQVSNVPARVFISADLCRMSELACLISAADGNSVECLSSRAHFC